MNLIKVKSTQACYLSLLVGVVASTSFVFELPLLYIIGIAGLLFLLKQCKSFFLFFVVSGLYALAFYSSGLYNLFLLSQHFDFSDGSVVLFTNSLIVLFFIVGFAVTTSVLYVVKNTDDKFWFILLMPAVFSFYEWVKTFLFTGFPWFQSSHLLVDYFDAEFSIFGELGVSYLFYSFIGFMCFVFLNLQKNTFKFSVIISFFLFILVWLNHLILHSFVYSDRRVHKTISVKIINTQTTLSNKNNTPHSVSQLIQAQDISQLMPKPDLVLLPEGSIQRSLKTYPNSVKDGFKKLKNKNISVLAGGYYEDLRGAYNTVYSNENNKPVYMKQHLIPFAEYMPNSFSLLENYFPKINRGNLRSKSYYSDQIQIAGVKVAPMICFEVFFSAELNKKAKGAEIISVFTDLAFFKDEWPKRYMLNVARVRAMEYSKPLVQSANGGISAIIDQKGSIIQYSKPSMLFLENKLELSYKDSFYASNGYVGFLLLPLVGIMLLMLASVILISKNKEKFL